LLVCAAALQGSVRTVKVLKEFRDFINKGNVVDLAVAVVIGGAFGKIVSALVSDLVMPFVNAVMPQGDWRKWEVTPLHFRVGDFLGTLVDFAIVAFVIFIIMVKVVGTVNRKAAATKACPECLEAVPLAAKRCRACTSVLTVFALMLLAAPAAAQPKGSAYDQNPVPRPIPSRTASGIAYAPDSSRSPPPLTRWSKLP
jgi:large conductance mechanosensitive channel